MIQDNASFTFLHRIEEVELNIEDGRWQSALALALTLPDICGGIAFPEIVKRYRDGRAVLDRNQRPTRDVGNQYIRWFDTYAAPFFKVSAQDISPYICGERCWQLRCEYLHQNKGFANTEDNIENDLLNNFRRLGVMASTMNGKERLRLMHSMFHMGDNDKFFFDWKYLVESGLSVKDFIAPTAFAFQNSRTFQMGSIYGSMSYLQIIASDLSDRMLADFLDMESSQIVTMHIQSVDQTAAIKTIKRTITELDRSKIEEQKKAVRSGYDMDIIKIEIFFKVIFQFIQFYPGREPNFILFRRQGSHGIPLVLHPFLQPRKLFFG